MAVSFRDVEDHSTWAFAGVHGHNTDRDRRLLWDGWLVYSVGGTCLVGGDFNVTCFPSEKLGEARLSLAMLEFFDFIFEQG